MTDDLVKAVARAWASVARAWASIDGKPYGNEEAKAGGYTEGYNTEAEELLRRYSLADAIEALTAERDALAAEVERLRGAMEDAVYLLIEATEQLRHGKIKTRRNRADNIDAFLASLKGEET